MSLRHPCKFQRLSRLGSVTERQLSSGRQPNFAVLNRGRHRYSVGQPSLWASAHILVVIVEQVCCYFKAVFSMCVCSAVDNGTILAGSWLCLGRGEL